MRGRLVFCPLAATVAVALLTAPEGQAKGIQALRVCGPSGCVAATGIRHGEDVLMVGTPVDRPARAEPYVRFRVTIGERGEPAAARFVSIFAPRAGLLRSTDEHGAAVWTRPSRAALRDFRRISRGVRRYPASTLPRDPAPAAVDTTPVEIFEPAAARTTAAGDGPRASAAIAGGAVALLVLTGAGLVVRHRRAG